MLAAFQALMAGSALSKMGSGKPISEMTDANPTAVSKVTIVGCCCLGQCGNGPMVLVMPDQAWYRHVRPDEATAIMQWHQQDQL